MAQKWGIPVVGLEFVDKCLEGGKLLEADPFVVAGKTAAQQFSTGMVVGECMCVYGRSGYLYQEILGFV